MLNLASVIIGIAALFGAVIGFIPLLGWLNWFVIPFAVIGLVCGVVSQGTAGRNINLVVIAVGVLRLMIGGGII
jgi:hypothetical protein